MSSPLFVVDQIAVSYGKKQVLHDVSFSVSAGEVAGVLGPNGVGKSTMLKAAAGQLDTTAGTVLVKGVSTAEDKVRFDVGYLPDVGGLFTRLSVREHLELAARLWRLKDYRDRADYLVDRLLLGNFIDTPAAELSHGTARRCGTAVAFLAEPSVVLLDEPFDGVDPVAARAVRLLMREHADAGNCVVTSTHLLDVAERACDSLVMFASGTIIAKGTASELRVQSGEPGPLEDSYIAILDSLP